MVDKARHVAPQPRVDHQVVVAQLAWKRGERERARAFFVRSCVRLRVCGHVRARVHEGVGRARTASGYGAKLGARQAGASPIPKPLLKRRLTQRRQVGVALRVHLPALLLLRTQGSRVAKIASLQRAARYLQGCRETTSLAPGPKVDGCNSQGARDRVRPARHTPKAPSRPKRGGEARPGVADGPKGSSPPPPRGSG